MYNFDFSHKPNIVDRDCYFIPSGYDNLSLLKGFDLTLDLEKLYEERIPKTKVKSQVNVFILSAKKKRFIVKIFKCS